MYHEFRIMQVNWENYDLEAAKEISKKFGSATLMEMKMNISRLSLVDRGTLLRSVKSSVRTKQGFVDRVEFSYEFYGRIFENGANNVFGKGVKLETRQWRNPAISQYLGELNKDFAIYYASLIAETIQIEDVKLEM